LIILIGGFWSFTSLLFLQEADGQKTSNGIHYRLQLLYTNGEYLYLYFHFKNSPDFARQTEKTDKIFIQINSSTDIDELPKKKKLPSFQTQHFQKF
jgi:hypothetical protein